VTHEREKGGSDPHPPQSAGARSAAGAEEISEKVRRLMQWLGMERIGPVRSGRNGKEGNE
jgi:hypothetical protein